MKYTDELDLQNFKKVNTASWEGMKDNVFVRLINKKYLSSYGDIAYVPFMDLAITFSVQEKNKGSIVSHLLTNEELENMNISVSEAKQVALKNTTNDRKRRLLTMKESTIKDDMMYPILQIPEGMMIGAGGKGPQSCGIIVDTEENRDNVLILCNKDGAFGASYMTVFSVLNEIYERFGCENFYIVPLSVHEIMCIRVGYVTHEGEKPLQEVEDDLLTMIESFNDSSNNSWKNILTYKIYLYYGDDGNKLFLING